MSVASDVNRIPQNNFIANSLILCLLQSFCPSSSVFLEPQVQEYFVHVSIGTDLHNSAFLLAVVFCNSEILLF